MRLAKLFGTTGLKKGDMDHSDRPEHVLELQNKASQFRRSLAVRILAALKR
jgi:hypothetical protein